MAVSAMLGVNSTTYTANAASNSNSANAKSSTASSDQTAATLNYNNFLQLLIAQMKNQDPTNPMDATQQVAQLATFSQVEQSLKMNSNLTALIQSQGMSQATSFIGKTVTSSDGKTSGVVSEVQITSTGLVAITAKGDKINIESGIRVKGS